MSRPLLELPVVRAGLWISGFLLCITIFLQWDTGVRNDFTQNAWLPARLVLDGANPYAASRSYVDAALGVYSSDFVRFNSGSRYLFIYPLWVAAFFAPFGALPLPTATAVWRAANFLLLVWSVGAILKSSNPIFHSTRPARLAGLAVVIFLSFIYRESILTLYIGQFSIIALALLAAVWCWLASVPPKMQAQRLIGDALTGSALALLATKPQSVGLAVLLVGLWALSRRRYMIPVSAFLTMVGLLAVPLIFYPQSLGEWLSIVLNGQAGSQVEFSASVWGVSYALFGDSLPWQWIASALSLGGLLLLVPFWWRDLKNSASPLPLSLPLTLCVNSVISPYLLGYEQVLLLFPALVVLAASTTNENSLKGGAGRLRFALYVWMGVLPLLLVPVQSLLRSKTPLSEPPLIVQSATLLGVCLLVRLTWVRRTENQALLG